MPKPLLLVIAALLLAGEVHAQSGKAHANEAVPTMEAARGPEQESDRVRRLWASFGLGLGTLRGEEGAAFAGQLSAHRQVGHQVLSLRVAACTGLFGEVGLADVGVLVGWGAAGRVGLASVGVGVAAVQNAEGDFHTVGLPVQVQLFFNVGNVAGLGLYGFANVNAEQSFGGVTLSLSAGNL